MEFWGWEFGFLISTLSRIIRAKNALPGAWCLKPVVFVIGWVLLIPALSQAQTAGWGNPNLPGAARELARPERIKEGTSRLSFGFLRDDRTVVYAGREKGINAFGEENRTTVGYAHLATQFDRSLRMDLYTPRVEIQRTFDGPGGRTTQTFEGLGDSWFTLRWGPWSSGVMPGTQETISPQRIEWLAGVKPPTAQDTSDLGLTPPAGFSPGFGLGTGTYDLIYGAVYTLYEGGTNVAMTNVVREPGGANKWGYRTGRLYVQSLNASYTWSDITRGTLAVEGEFREPDRFQGAEVPNTGSTLWFLTPGITVTAGQADFEYRVQIPIDISMHGDQLAPDKIWTTGVTIRF